MSTMILVRGLPGSGKTTFACLLGKVVSADDYFYARGNGQYTFDPRLLPQAHQNCQDRAREVLGTDETLVVANTFSCRWELQPYLEMAREFGVRVTVIDLFDAGLTDEELAQRGLHGVPVTGIAAMRSRWEHDWKAGDPRAPWERG